MYKVVFADDEMLVRNKISEMIDWNTAGFSLVACCSNGYDLMEQMEKDIPDLVILDINMPFINGLEAARQIRNSYPHVRLVFLTGYADFDYAQQAVEIKAVKYIIKPVSEKELIDVLKEVRSDLDYEKKSLHRIAKLEYSYHCNHQVLMQDILNGEAKSETIYERANSCGFNWNCNTVFQVAVFSLDEFDTDSYWNNVDKNTLVFALSNVASELAKQQNIGYIFIRENMVVLIGYLPVKYLECSMQEFVQSILRVVSTKLNFTVTAGLGSICYGCANIQVSFAQAQKALELRARNGGNKLYTKEDLQQASCGHMAVWNAVNYIEGEYATRDFSADIVCEHLHISPSYLRALFKQETGLSIIGYITKVRMKNAKVLLDKGLKNYQIAELTGYSDSHYFGYCFKRYFGVTPVEMRAKNKKFNA